ncbi:molybdenum cofactor biosynthesis protein MoaE [Asticcacaulis taihuensis]|uniref:molybdenum cofactor biosynthesis protein MoaE n=1 Tax=Asticcacaulis taihuensis TaxID=260084 RepID=UPI003F7C2F7A
MEMDIRLLPAGFDPAAVHDQFLARFGALGAVTAFTGVVREAAKGTAVDYLYLDWYPGMTEASIQAIADAAAERFDIRALSIHHRCGEVRSGEPVVFVAAASAHRRAAFQAVDYMMDRLKSEAALWKREVGPQTDRWVEPTAGDADDLKRWSEK